MKKSKQAPPPSRSDPTSDGSCPMLTLLGRDCASQLYLTHFLELSELTQLAASCTTWSGWLHSPSSTLAGGAVQHCPEREQTCASLLQLERLGDSRLRHYVTSVFVDATELKQPDAAADEEKAQVAAAAAQSAGVSKLDQSLSARLLRFPHLCRLAMDLKSPAADAMQQALQSDALAPLWSRLTHLQLSLRPCKAEADRLARALVELLPSMARLQSLRLTGGVFVRDGLFRLLPSLPHLHTLVLRAKVDHATPFQYGSLQIVDFHCSPTQAALLAQCRSLTHLHCGSWDTPSQNSKRMWAASEAVAAADAAAAASAASVSSASSSSSAAAQPGAPAASTVAPVQGYYFEAEEEEFDDDEDDDEEDEEDESETKEGTAARVASLRSFVDTRLRLQSQSQGAAVAPLKYLGLSSTPISSGIWAQLLRMPSLIKLDPPFWRRDVDGEDDFGRLAYFESLTHFAFERGHEPDDDDEEAPEWDEEGEEPLGKVGLPALLPALLRCARLELLRIRGGNGDSLTAEQLGQLVAAFPRVRVLQLEDLPLESVAPLADARALQRLWLSYCPDLHGQSVQYRSILPSLPALTELQLYDRDRLTAEQVAPLNKALLRRMPMLRKSGLHERLKANPLLP